MNFIEKIKTIERIDALIRRQGTGSPSNLALRLEVSERCVYDIINVMKLMDAPIYFCSARGSYCYRFKVDLLIGFMSQEIIKGGSEKYYPTAIFLQWDKLSLHQDWI